MRIKKITFILLILFLLVSGCTETPKDLKFVHSQDSTKYVMFNADGTAFYHTGGIQNYQGTWEETDTDYTMFLPDWSSVVFEKYDNGSIGMKLRNENTVLYERDGEL